MDINSTPILTFPISDENRENYGKVGIEKYLFDRTKRKFSFGTILNQTIEILIKKDWKSKEIIEAVNQKLINDLPPMSNSIKEFFESSVMPDIESQIDNNIDQITKSYAEEQREINPLVRDAIMIREQNPQKITKADIDFIFDTIKKEAKDDDLAIRLLFYSAKSTFTNLVIGLVVDSKDPGAGKSYILFLYIEYEPEKYVKFYAYLSGKALYHQEGINVIEEEDGKLTEVDPIIKDLRQQLEQVEADLAFAKKEVKRVEKDDEATREDIKQAEDACKEIIRKIAELKGEITTYENRTEKLVIFTHRIIVVPDTPEEEELFNILMSILSQDTNRDTIYMYTDRNSKNQQSARKIRLRGTPGFIYSKVIGTNKNPRAKEVNRRFPHANPNTTRRKIKNAIDLGWTSFGSTDDEKDLDIVNRADKQKVKKLMALINADLIIHSTYFKHKESGCHLPFKKTMKSLASYNTPWQMTVQERARKYLSTIARVNMDFRPKLINKRTGQPYIFILFEDVQTMYYLMQHGALSVSPFLMYWYNKVFLPCFAKDAKRHSKATEKGGKIEESEFGLYAAQLKKSTDDFLGASLSTQTIMEQYINPLSEQGIIEKIHSDIDKRTYVLRPVDKSKLTSEFLKDIVKAADDDSELTIDKIKIRIKDPNDFPSRNLIEEP